MPPPLVAGSNHHVGIGLADEILELWLDTPFEGGRHQRRVDLITAIEDGSA